MVHTGGGQPPLELRELSLVGEPFVDQRVAARGVHDDEPGLSGLRLCHRLREGRLALATRDVSHHDTHRLPTFSDASSASAEVARDDDAGRRGSFASSGQRSTPATTTYTAMARGSDSSPEMWPSLS